MDKYVVLTRVDDLGSADPFANANSLLGPFMNGPVSTGLLSRSRFLLGSADLSKREVLDLTRDRNVLAVARDIPTRLVEPLQVEDGVGSTWGLQALGVEDSVYTGQGVTVAVLDTGIDAAHPAFAGVDLVQRDFTGEGNGDGNGHGTHCAGTIFGRDVGDQRIGVARGVERAYIGKVLDSQGRGSSRAMFEALKWVQAEGVHVVSMSLGFDFAGWLVQLQDQYPPQVAASIALQGYRSNLRMFDALMGTAAAELGFGHGGVYVAAAGNESQRPEYEIGVSLPAAADGMISVGALGRTPQGLTVADFSNTYPQVSAPGVRVVSAWPGGRLRALSGTSMATPHVAGAAALWWQAALGQWAGANARQVAANLRASCSVAELAPGVDQEDRGNGLVKVP